MKILPQFTKSAISVSVLCLFPLCSSASWGDSSGEGPTHETFPAYEVGDIAIFGPADEDLEEVGHSAILGPRLKVGTVWEVQLIDVMPTGGVTANQDVGVHGPLEKILTVSGLADGAWTSAKQSERADIYNSASQRIGSQYITIEPPNTSDLSWSYINSLVTAYNGSNYVIQSDSIYATPAGGHDYFPRQKGAEVGRYTCVGFTEGIYESLGLDITPSGQEAVEYSYDAWYTLGIDLARAYVFWPSVQRDNGTASQPKGPEVSITIPAHNSVFNETDITVEGEAKDVSGLREDEILLKHTAPDGESTEYEVPVSVSDNSFSLPLLNLAEGAHKLEIISYDKAGNLSAKFSDGSTEVDFIVDGKRPYVESVSIYNDEPNAYYPTAGTLIYDRKWKASDDVLISTGPDVDLPLTVGLYHAVITFSEFIADGSVDIGPLGETLEISSEDNPTTHKTVATAGFTIGDGMYSKDTLQTLAINATDYAGNMLLQIAPDRTEIDPATELTRDSAGVMQGVGGPDTMHALRIDAAAPEIGWADHSQIFVSTCPGVCGTQAAPLEFNYSTVKFRYQELGSGLGSSEIRKESGEVMWAVTYPEVMYYYDTALMLPDGKYRQTVIDKAGRERVMWFRVDTVSPLVEVPSVSVSRNFGTFSVSGTVQDSLSGLKAVALMNNLVSSAPVSLIEGTTEQVDFNFTNVDASVDAYYKLHAEDTAGNVSQVLMQFKASSGIMRDSDWTVGHHVTGIYAQGSTCTIKLTGTPNSYDVPLNYDYNTTVVNTSLDVESSTTPVLVATLDAYMPGKLELSVSPQENPGCSAWVEGSSLLSYQAIPHSTETNNSILYSTIAFSYGWLDVMLENYSVTGSDPEFVLKSAESPQLPSLYVAYPFTAQSAWSVRYSGISYDNMTLRAYGLPPGLTTAELNSIKMFEYSDGGGGGVNITVSVDSSAVTGRTTSNSVFVVGVPVGIFDKTGPITTMWSTDTYMSGGVIYVSSSAGVSLYSTDTSSVAMALAGVASTYYLIDVSPTPECLSTAYDPYAASGTCANPVYTGPFLVAEGLHSMYYNAADNIGNYGAGVSTAVYSDGTAPWTELMLNGGALSPGTTAYAGVSDVITLVSSDTVSNGVASGLATSYFLIDVAPSACATSGGGGIGGVGSCANPYYGGPLSLPVGEHVIYYLAADNVGNQEPLKSVNFSISGSSQTTFGIVPSSGPIGVSFVISGAGFGSYSEDYSGMLLGDVTAQISSWSDSSIAAQVPGTLAVGGHAVSVLSGTTTLAEIGTFTVTTPSVYSIDPATGAIGMPFTLTGESFGEYADGHTWVVVGGTTAVITYWSDSLVIAEFPASLSAGTHAVQVLRMYDDTLVESATVYADIEEPVISTMTPTSGSAGSEFLLEGTGFGNYVSSYTRVMAGGLECELTMWVSTAIAGVIPSELEIGTYTVVAVRGEAVSNGIEYTVSGYRAQSARSYSTASLEFKLGEVYVYPDPAKGGKIPKFHVEVGLADTVRIRVYNVAGEQVHSRTLSGSPQAVGSVYAYEYPWEGRIASGVYYYTMEAERAGKKLKAKGKFAVVR